MDAALLRQLVAVESAPAHTETMPLRPQPSVTKTYPAVPQRDGTSIELSVISSQATQSGGFQSGLVTATRPSGTAASDLEVGRPSGPVEPRDGGVEALQSMWDPYMNRFRLLSACLTTFLNGMSDAASGPILPHMEKYYDIGYAVVSLIFVGQAIGFILGARLIDPLRERVGRGRALALAELLIAGGYAILSSTAPFPAIVAAYFLLGLGMTITLALGNIFCGGLANSTTALGAMHGSYGVGGICGPLLANAFVSALGVVWSRFYLLTLGLSVLNGVVALWSYWGFEAEHPDTLAVTTNATATATPTPPGTSPPSSSSSAALSHLRTALGALSSRVVLLGALFIFAYQGAEVSISGWVVSFLEDARGGAPGRVGYVTAGFWAGVTLGRLGIALVLLFPPRAGRRRGGGGSGKGGSGERPFVYAAVVGAAALELLVWLVPSVAGDAAAVAGVGLLLGPVYPCAAAVFMRTMSRGERLRGMGVISAFGASGGAVAPFSTGLLSQASGTFVLHPIAIGLCGAMLVCWYGLPSERKRRE